MDLDPLGSTITEGLEEYLAAPRHAEKKEIEEIRSLVDELVGLFVRMYSPAQQTWPLQLVANIEPEPPIYSFSTTAMILFALSLATGRVHGSTLVPAVGNRRVLDRSRPDLAQEVDQLAQEALDGLVNRSLALRAQDGSLTSSGTFGRDDPFTLTWLIDVLKENAGPDRAAYLPMVADRALQRVTEILASSDPLSQVLNIADSERVSHSFPLLRVLQLGEAVNRQLGRGPFSRTTDLSGVRALLFQRIHLGLSESAIRDSQFDAADLVFALESWILCSPVQPDYAVVDRVFDVLTESEERTPYWRALRPFKVTQQGLALLPQSVEVANSLLRICGSPLMHPVQYFSENINLFKRYSRWLLGRAFRGFASTDRDDRAGFVGWESDHTYTLNRIHLWQTSQVLIFLEHYLAMLQEHIAQKTLDLAGFRVRGTAAQRESWERWKDGEPLKSSGSERSQYHVYEQIGIDFVDPRTRSEAARTSFSMLLYGPPGTGKSTIAEKLADVLGQRLVTVTPSDFISAGGEGVEARAKAIFDVLTEQRDVVVLFDEIDQLLLDRDSTLYRQQGDLFKLLTPGMLTKIGELSRLRRILLVIATNYYERIDRAIKRPGRIDGRYLVLPPNRVQRTMWLAHEFGNLDLGFRLDDWSSISDQVRTEISRETVRFTYKELTSLAVYVRKRNPNVHRADLGHVILRTVPELPPIITLEAYGPRLGVDGTQPVDIEQPWEEFAMLAYLELDAKQKLPDKPDWVEPALRTALERGVVADKTIADSLAATLPPLQAPLPGT